MTEWVVDQPSGNMCVRGGNASKHVVTPDIDTLQRETAQNSKDQRLGTDGAPARMRYTLFELSGEAKADFLNAMDWKGLGPHVKAAGKGTGGANAQLRQGYASMESDVLRVLRIEDFGTYGLTGDDTDVDKNFGLLCKSEFKTSDQAGRGGSYGLGKAVLWTFSRISTVLFSSIPEDQTDLRTFGRSDLSYHVLNKKQYDATGCFGNRIGDGASARAESEWGKQDLAASLKLSRDAEDGSGTSILIVDFFEPQYDQPRPLEEIAKNICESAAKWFWPSISIGKPTLEIEVVAQDSKNAIVFSEKVNPSLEWSPFIDTLNAPTPLKHAKEVDDVAKSEIQFTVPARISTPKHEEFKDQLELRALKAKIDLENHEVVNTVAVIRGAGMVVKYHPLPKPLDGFPIFGVLTAGSYLRSGSRAANSEEFFRSSEPVLHDKWELTDSIRENYKPGAGARLKSLWHELADNVKVIVDQGVQKHKKGPEALAKLFPLGSSGPKKKVKKSVVTHILGSAFNGKTWDVEGEVVCAHFDSKPWSTTVGFLADVESGRGEYLSISSISIKPSKGVTLMGTNDTATLKVSGSIERFKFKVSLDAPAGMAKADLARTRIKFTH